MDGDPGLVPASPSRLVEPPHQVDVLTESEGPVEATDVVEGGGAHHDRRGGDVADATPGTDAGGLVSEIERSRRITDDTRRDESDSWVVEVGEQRREPVVCRKRDIGIDEREQRRRCVSAADVAGSAGTDVAFESDRCPV